MIIFVHTQNLSKKKNESTPLAGAKGVATYGANTSGEEAIGDVSIKGEPELPTLCPFIRLVLAKLFM